MSAYLLGNRTDGTRDLLLGNRGLDWFFAGQDDQTQDQGATEQIN